MKVEDSESLFDAVLWRNRVVLIGLGAVCTVIFAAFYILLDLRATDAEGLGLTARQRMLIMQVALNAERAEHAKNADDRNKLLAEVGAGQDALEKLREQIARGDKPFRRLFSPRSWAILYDPPHRLDEQLGRYLALAAQLHPPAQPDAATDFGPVIDQLEESIDGLMTTVEILLAQMASDSRDRINAIAGLAAGCLAAALLLLLFGQARVFRPLARRWREATAESQLLRHAIEQSSAAVMITDARGIIRYVNPALCRTTGYAPDEVIGQSPVLFRSGVTEQDIYRIIWDAVSAGEHWSGELLGRRKDGSHYWELVEVSPLRDRHGRITHYVTVGDDISDRKEHERDLAEARFIAENASRAKSQFLANMSHELRTPLNAIIGFSDVIRRGIFGSVANDKYKDYVDSIHGSGEHLLALINDILDLSAIEAGKFELHEEPLSLASVVGDCLRLVQPQAERGKIRLSVALPDDMPELIADRRRLKQILVNLLTNAVKFTPADGEVRLCGKLVNGNGLRIDVRDSGIGMSPEDIAKALQPFGRVSNQMTRHYEGTGLGLPLTKNLIERHGGSLSIISAPNSGTTVSIHLPASRLKRPPPATRSRNAM